MIPRSSHKMVVRCVGTHGSIEQETQMFPRCDKGISPRPLVTKTCIMFAPCAHGGRPVCGIVAGKGVPIFWRDQMRRTCAF